MYVFSCKLKLLLYLFRFAHFGSGSGIIWMDDVQCVGNENSIGLCPFNGWAIHNCNHYEDAGVSCAPGNEYHTALIPGNFSHVYVHFIHLYYISDCY